MKYHVVVNICILFFFTVSWTQGNESVSFDMQKSQEELQTMKNIFTTTIRFVGQNAQKTQATMSSPPSGTRGNMSGSGSRGYVLQSLGTSSIINSSYPGSSSSLTIDAYYLDGQGAVFIFQSSNWYRPNNTARGTGSLATASNAPPASTQPAQPASDEDLQTKLRELQDNARQSLQFQEAERARLEVFYEETKSNLIEAAANYGDSLTTVKPDEHVTLVLLKESSSPLAGNSGLLRSEIISAQKLWIMDYKAGSLTMEAFKEKILQYKTASFDTQEFEVELQTMKDIFSTTINFARRNVLQSQTITSSTANAYFPSRSSNIIPYYYGQGVMFIFSSSNWTTPNLSSLSSVLSRQRSGFDTQPSSSQSAQSDSEGNIQRRLREQQDQAIQLLELQNATRAKTAEFYEQVKGYLIEAIANYGKSMGTLKADEYITLVLMPTPDTISTPFGAITGRDSRFSHCDIISVQKAWITDYKAGALTMDEFKRKVLQYTQ